MLIILSLLIILSISLYFLNSEFKFLEFFSLISILISGGCLLFSLIALPISYFEYNKIKFEGEELQKAVDNYFDRGEIERAGIINKIIVFNTQLEKSKFYNKGLFDIWILDEIENIKSIEIKKK